MLKQTLTAFAVAASFMTVVPAQSQELAARPDQARVVEVSSAYRTILTARLDETAIRLTELAADAVEERRHIHALRAWIFNELATIDG